MENIHDFGGKYHEKWTEEEYDRAAIAAENRNPEVHDQLEMSSDSSEDDSDIEQSGDVNDEDEDEVAEKFGVKHMCPLNSLQSFHATTGFPPDILHDLFEGVISQDLLGTIRILNIKKWFSIEDYNQSMERLKYKGHEASDRPQPVPMNKKTKKLKGKACSIWVHVRNFPFIVRKFVKDIEDPILTFGLKLHEITERITALEFKDYEVDVLEQLILDYLDERKVIFEDYPIIGSPKPKTHFLAHYPAAIRLYGPPLSYWTARYESRHRIAKNTAEASKNFINISLTVSTRQQMRLSSVFYHGMFPKSDIVISDKITFKSSLKGSTEFDKSLLSFMSETDFLCSEVQIRNQLYKNSQLVVLELLSPDELKVGLILSILVKDQSVFFVNKQYLATRHTLQYFHVQSDDPTIAFSDATKIVDYKPLINHGTASQVFFCLHHHLSYSYP